MADRADPEFGLGRLGRSRVYRPGDTPDRLFEWHQPRAGRWERLRVMAGVLQVESCRNGVIRAGRLKAAADAWIGPGERWRVMRIDAGTRFEIEVHGKAAAGTACIPPERARLLEEALLVRCRTTAELETALSEVDGGTGCLVRGEFDLRRAGAVLELLRGGTLSWHPLGTSGDRFVAFVQRVDVPLAMDAYLRRDHAVIESALAGFLKGRGDRFPWLANLLERHIRIEEELLFPPYLAAGGRAAWVRSLEMEHRQLLRLLSTEAAGGNRWVRMLDSHDEKEERIVYPDVIRTVGASGEDLVRRAILFPFAG